MPLTAYVKQACNGIDLELTDSLSFPSPSTLHHIIISSYHRQDHMAPIHKAVDDEDLVKVKRLIDLDPAYWKKGCRYLYASLDQAQPL